MPRYRKKPVEIEAVQFTPELALACLKTGDPFAGLPVSGSYNGDKLYNAYVFIETLEGRMKAKCGDWIIRGVKGELYPCKDEIFKLTYEAV